MNLQELTSASAIIKQELEPLAQKIGQGIEYTFGIFVKQVYVEAFQQCFWILPGIILIFLGKKLIDWEKQGKFIDEDKNVGYVLAILTFGLAIFAIFYPLFVYLIPALLNPEYKAIELIISTFKSSSI